ncbi:MAG: Arm DNA-binding domain-containing protein [Lachnospiraceae bacterium]|nr:Arm DNA-binding domain-containing protein [Lachnospiraceae bacterium]
MAVLKNDKTGKWEVRTYYKDFIGATRQKTKRGFATKHEAQDWERAFQLQQDQNMDMFFEDFVEIYTNDKKPRVKLNTWMSKNDRLNRAGVPARKPA